MPSVQEKPNTPAPTQGPMSPDTPGINSNAVVVSGPQPQQRNPQHNYRLQGPQPAPVPRPINRSQQQMKGHYPPQVMQEPLYNKADTFSAFLLEGRNPKSPEAAANQIEKPNTNLQAPMRKEFVAPSDTVRHVKNANTVYPSSQGQRGGFGIVSGGLSSSKVHPMAIKRAKERLQPSESPSLSGIGSMISHEQRGHRLGSYQHVLQSAGVVPEGGQNEVLWAVRTTPAESKIIYQDVMKNQVAPEKSPAVHGFYKRDMAVEKQPQPIVAAVGAPRQQSLSNGPVPMELEKSRHSVKSRTNYPQVMPQQGRPQAPEPRPQTLQTVEKPVKMAVIDPPVQKQQIQKEAPQQQLIEKHQSEAPKPTTAKPAVHHVFKQQQHQPRHQSFRFRSSGFGIPQVRPAAIKKPSNGAIQYVKGP